ncbi:MAG: CrcB family protein [Acidimicrobiales bacterium]
MPASITLTPKQFGFALLCVVTGGGVGTLLRDLLLKIDVPSTASATFVLQPSWTSEIPWVLLIINTVGVFVATDLLRHRLKHRDPNSPLRLFLITGFLGGFTSYSSLFVDFAAIWHRSIGGCLFVAVGAILAGVFAGMLGLGRRRRRT